MDKISAVCIVKNNQDTISDSIDSYKDIVDEVVIIDTGSTDRTINICKEKGCVVYNFKWNDNFSDARNYAISKVNFDYILFLDSDEFFYPKLKACDKDRIINIFKTYNCDAVSFYTKNIDSDTFKFINEKYGTKIFKNNKHIKYRRNIHEILYHEKRDLFIVSTDDFCINHVGYSKNKIGDKCRRNISILKKIENPETIDYMYLTRDNLFIENYVEAKCYCDKFFESEDFEEAIDSSDIAYQMYFYKLKILKHFNEDVKGYLIGLQKVIPDIPELYYEISKYYFNTNFEKSYNYLIKCIKKNDGFSAKCNNLINNYPNFESDLYYRLAYIDFIYGRDKMSINRCAVSCMLNNKNINSISLLFKLISSKDNNFIIDLISKIFALRNVNDYDFITNCLVDTKMRDVFRYFASIYNMKYNGNNNTVFIAVILNNQVEECIEKAIEIYDVNKNPYNQFIVSLAIMYMDDMQIYKKYKDHISKDYQNILDYYFCRCDIKENNMSEYTKLCIRMMYMIKDFDVFKYLDFDIISEKDIYDVVCAEYNINNYKHIIRIVEYVYEKRCVAKHNKDILKMYIISCKKEGVQPYKNFDYSDVDLSFRKIGGIK